MGEESVCRNIHNLSIENRGQSLGMVTNRTTTISRPSFQAQSGRSCYAHAATSAYINTCARISGLYRSIPSYNECLEIADYNCEPCGDPAESIRRLEAHFQCSVCWECSSSKPRIKDISALSVIVIFTTSEAGWDSVFVQGELLTRPAGVSNGWYATLIESYDLRNNWATGKNSWGHETAKDRFHFRFEAFHDFRIVTVFFTTTSIKGKTVKTYDPRLLN
jgi:RNA polymerase-binding transcription factor DksA